MIKWRFVLRFAGLGSVVERSATKAEIAQASLSAARRGARSDVAHVAPGVAAACTVRMGRGRGWSSDVILQIFFFSREKLRFFLDD